MAHYIDNACGIDGLLVALIEQKRYVVRTFIPLHGRAGRIGCCGIRDGCHHFIIDENFFRRILGPARIVSCFWLPGSDQPCYQISLGDLCAGLMFTAADRSDSLFIRHWIWRSD
jgi:hypothetical protein